MSIIKTNGDVLLLSDIVCVRTYKFKKYEIISIDSADYIVGHNGEKPFEANRLIDPTQTITVSDRKILDSLLILASKVFSVTVENSFKLFLTWCEEYGLPFCSVEDSKKAGYLACRLLKFRDFLFLLKDTFQKVESMYEDFTIEQSIDADLFEKNPYRRHNNCSNYFTEERKESLVAEFVNNANLSFRFEYRNREPTFYNYASDIISLARYQFALILLSTSESIPRHCKCCGSMFFAHRKNKLYCPFCTRQKRYAAEKRRKKKEGVSQKNG